MTAIGLSLPATAAAARAQVPGLFESDLLNRIGEPIKGASVPLVGKESLGCERLLPLAAPALREALLPLSHIDWRRLRSRWYLGTPPERPGFPAHFTSRMSETLLREAKADPASTRIEVISRGHSSTHLGLERAVRALCSRHAEICVVGGVESYWHPDTLDWLDESGRLSSGENLDGFIPGEGAGFLVLATAERARRQGLPCLATLLATATAEEPHPLSSTGISIGAGLTTAVQQVLHAEKADWVVCDMNGESYRATEWAYAYLRTGKRHRDPLLLWHPADTYGDVGAASGAILMGIALSSFRRRYARGPSCLTWTSSDDGLRGAALLSAPSGPATR